MITSTYTLHGWIVETASIDIRAKNGRTLTNPSSKPELVIKARARNYEGKIVPKPKLTRLTLRLTEDGTGLLRWSGEPFPAVNTQQIVDDIHDMLGKLMGQ